MKKANITKNQHYIPQVYLRGFSLGNDLVCRYDIKNDKQQNNIPIDSIFFEKYLYEKQDKNGFIDINSIEKKLKIFEDEFKKMRDALISKASLLENTLTDCFLTADEKLFWKKYIILQMVRHNDSLKMVENMVVDELSLADKNQIHNIAVEYCLSMYSDIKPNAFDYFLPVFEKSAINIAYDESGSFVTNEKCGVFHGTGQMMGDIKEWGFIYFPISAFVIVCFYNTSLSEYKNEHKNKLIHLNENGILKVNQIIASSAKQVIISPKPLTKEEIQFIKRETQNALL